MPTDTPTTIADSQGLSFSFNGVDASAVLTSVKRKATAEFKDVTPLSAASGTTRKLQVAPLYDGEEISCEFMGNAAFTKGVSGSITCVKLSITGTAVVTDVEVTAARGELLMGTATLKLTST
jgi:hypothetical protein